MTTIENALNARALGRKPTDDEIDFFGLTHQGKVRKDNQDHFLVSSLHKRMDVHHTSLPDRGRVYAEVERLAYLAMVADGVGGGPAGEEASRLALEAVSQYVSGSMDCYYTADPTDDQAFTQALADAAQHHHHRGAGGTKRRVKVGSRLPTWKPEGWKPAGRGRYSVRFREAGRSPAWPATSSRLQSRQHLTHIVVRSRCLWRIRWLLRGWVAESG